MEGSGLGPRKRNCKRCGGSGHIARTCKNVVDASFGEEEAPLARYNLIFVLSSCHVHALTFLFILQGEEMEERKKGCKHLERAGLGCRK